ncbi:hypothetical protein J40TS1_37980 [Paenibacillus montaniterrae]|uniref:Uncharacterized protein n=1 Tax=Paenibacillus montaniterrae TaxID=429341 RepID=A0A920CYS4_9BACL|nr:hypothetical protein [Paenibacillus montaniterrae]GIP18156.1 hypothetical protein J40TS1_37980 [Paenibacillus montaniterrae]
MSLVHDNEILSYEVDLYNTRIVLHTLYENKRLIEYTDVTFEGVLCHMFEHQLSGSIILTINEYELDYFFRNEENLELLSKTKNYGWPMIYEDAVQLEQNLKQSQYKYIVIMSSYGLNGWILAKEWLSEIAKRKIGI